jgi:hypothetical protein
MCIHCLGCLPHPPNPLLPGRTCSAFFFSDFVQENIRNNNKEIEFLLAWNKDSYTERFLALLPCTCVLQPALGHLYQTSSQLLGHLPIVVSANLRLLYLLLNREHINHIQVSGFLLFPIPPVCVLPLVCDPCPIILPYLFWVYNLHMRENMWFLAFWAWVTLSKMMYSISIYLLSNDKISLVFVAE